MVKIFDLISSDLDETDTAKKLIEKFKKEPELINDSYLSGRSIFHLLVIKNKTAILDILFANPNYKTVALNKRDNYGQTILHVAVSQDYKLQECLERLTHHFPELLNVKNSAGNTPLLEAVQQKQIWAVSCLVKNNIVDKSLVNATGKSALQLARADQEMKNALLFIDLDKIKPSTVRLRQSPSPTNDQQLIQATFPILSSRSSEEYLSSTGSLDSLSSSSRLELLTNSFKSDDSFSSDFTEDSIDPISYNNISIDKLVEKLITAPKTEQGSQSYSLLVKQFFIMSQECILTSTQPDWLHNTSLSSSALHRILLQLYPLVKNHLNTLQNENYKVLSSFFTLLVYHGVNAENVGAQQPDFMAIASNKEQAKILELIWLLTSCKSSIDDKRALGLLNEAPVGELLNNLQKLYPYYDKQQKLAANYIALKLVIFHLSPGIELSSVILSFRLFIENNTNKQCGLKKLGSEINEQMNSYIERNTIFFNQSVFINFNIINQWQSQHNNAKNEKSFVTLVEDALAKKSKKNKVEVELIANELRCLTLNFYQQVSGDQFNNDSALEKSTQYFNKLSNFFINKILSQKPENITNCLQLLVQLTRSICLMGDDYYLDLNHLMVLSSIFNTSSIMRLSSSFDALPDDDKKAVNELQQMVSGINFKWMREMYKTHRATLPFPGMFKTDITFAIDGNNVTDKQGDERNQLLISRTEVMGEIYSKIGEIKSLLTFEIFRHYTDLPQLLNQYCEVSETDLYQASHKMQPTVFDIDKASKNWVVTLNNLNDSLQNNLIPAVRYKKQVYVPSLEGLSDILLTFFSKNINQGILEKHILKLEEVLLTLSNIYNKKHSSNSTTVVANKYYFLSKTQKLKEQLSTPIATTNIVENKKNIPKRSLFFKDIKAVIKKHVTTPENKVEAGLS